jgi:DNA (cytosine-5)-methyltransferase 1
MNNQLKVFEMFAGYGGASFSLKKANINFKCIGYSEIDKNAIKCFNQNHPGITNYYNCKNIELDWLPDFDLLTGGFPCQDLSIAGKRDLTKGRSLLINEIFRIIKIKKPKYLFLENVEGLLSMIDFWNFVKFNLKKLGYFISYKLLYSSNYNIPQYRPRVYIFCKREPFEFMEQVFPEKEKLKIFIKDILEKEVNKKYYYDLNIWKERKKFLMNFPQNKINIIYNLSKSGYHCGSNIYDINGICETLTSSSTSSFGINKPFRKFTPKECFRLMGFLNDEINLDNLTDNQLYKLAGNGWDVNLVSKIFKIIFKDYILK